jgi:hypothetical protein
MDEFSFADDLLAHRSVRRERKEENTNTASEY